MAERITKAKARRETRRRTEAAREKVDKAARKAAGDPDLDRLDVEIRFAEKKVERLQAKFGRVAIELSEARDTIAALRRVRARAEGGK